MNNQSNHRQGGTAIVERVNSEAAGAIGIGELQIGGVTIIPQSMGEIMEFAKMMAVSDKAVRKHLRGNAGACFAIALQSFRWGMDPFAVASKSFEVNDQIAYEAQLIAAVIIKNAPIKDRPDYLYEGEGENRVCTVRVETNSGKVIEYTSPKFGKITPKNSPLWKSDPDQQQGYYSVRAMARKHFPDILMGVYDPEEAETMKDVTPREPTAKRSATAALDNLQSRRSAATTIDSDDARARPTQGQDTPGSDETALPSHDEDGVVTDGSDIAPTMPDDILSAWEEGGRWGKAFSWIKEQSEAVDGKTLGLILFRCSDIVDKAANYGDAGRDEVEALRAKVGEAK